MMTSLIFKCAKLEWRDNISILLASVSPSRTRKKAGVIGQEPGYQRLLGYPVRWPYTWKMFIARQLEFILEGCHRIR